MSDYPTNNSEEAAKFQFMTGEAEKQTTQYRQEKEALEENPESAYIKDKLQNLIGKFQLAQSFGLNEKAVDIQKQISEEYQKSTEVAPNERYKEIIEWLIDNPEGSRLNFDSETTKEQFPEIELRDLLSYLENKYGKMIGGNSLGQTHASPESFFIEIPNSGIAFIRTENKLAIHSLNPHMRTVLENYREEHRVRRF